MQHQLLEGNPGPHYPASIAINLSTPHAVPPTNDVAGDSMYGLSTRFFILSAAVLQLNVYLRCLKPSLPVSCTHIAISTTARLALHKSRACLPAASMRSAIPLL